MKYHRQFVFNPDFGWYQTTIAWEGEAIQIFVSGQYAGEVEAVHRRLVRLMRWLGVHRELLRKQAFIRSIGCVPTDESIRMPLLSISLEDPQRVEFLFKNVDLEQFVYIFLDEQFEIIACQLEQ